MPRNNTARKRTSQSGITARAFAAFAKQVSGQFTDLRDHMDQRFAQVDQRFDRLEQRFDGLEQRFDGLEQRFDGVEGDIGRLQAASDAHGRQLKDIQHALEKKVDREEVEVIVEQVVARTGKR